MNDLETKSMESLAKWLGTLGDEVGDLATVLESESNPRAARKLAERCLSYWTRSAQLKVDGIDDLLLIDVALVFRTLADFSVIKTSTEPGSATALPPEGQAEDAVSEPALGDTVESEVYGLVNGEKSLDAESLAGESGSTQSESAQGQVPEPELVAEQPGESDILERLSRGAATVRQLLGDDYGSLARFASNLQDVSNTEGESNMEEAEARSTLIEDARRWAKQYRPPTQRVDDNALITLRAFVQSRYVDPETTA